MTARDYTCACHGRMEGRGKVVVVICVGVDVDVNSVGDVLVTVSDEHLFAYHISTTI
jgi:hypothetical protein